MGGARGGSPPRPPAGLLESAPGRPAGGAPASPGRCHRRRGRLLLSGRLSAWLRRLGARRRLVWLDRIAARSVRGTSREGPASRGERRGGGTSPLWAVVAGRRCRAWRSVGGGGRVRKEPSAPPLACAANDKPASSVRRRSRETPAGLCDVRAGVRRWLCSGTLLAGAFLPCRSAGASACDIVELWMCCSWPLH